MSKLSFEEYLKQYPQLIYPNVGDSMLPLLRENRDLMVIERRPNRRLKKYEVPLYRRDNGEYILHRIIRVKKDGYVLRGDNCKDKEYGITDEHIVGILTGVIRDGETISVKSFRYRLFVHLWCDCVIIRKILVRIHNIISRKS